MDLKSHIGQKLGPYPEKADSERIKRFMTCVGAPDSQAWEVPATFVTVCRQGEFDWVEKLGFNISEVLHGEQEYQYVKPIRLGETISYETTLSNVMEKRGSKGSMIFIIMESEVFEADARDLRVKCKTTFIIRRPA